MELSATKAAQEVGVTVPTITKAIKEGKLSARKTDNGKGYLIDGAELFRVFPIAQKLAKDKASQTPEELALRLQQMEEKFDSAQDQIEDLKSQREEWKALTEDLKGQREDIKTERDNWQKQADKLALMLPSPETQEAPKKKGLLGRLFGSK